MIYLGGDKHGYKTILYVKEYLAQHNIQFEDRGVQDPHNEQKIEEIIEDVAQKVRKNEQHVGILSCGTGVGVEVGVNKFSGIRGCLATNKTIAKYAIEKDKCNVLCLVGWHPNRKTINGILEAWFTSQYDGNVGRLQMFQIFNSWH